MNKRYFFNTLKALFLLLLVSGGTACNSWLDVKPENEQPNDEFWNNKEEVDAVMMGAAAASNCWCAGANCAGTLRSWVPV